MIRTPKVFIDCNRCDDDYIRTEIDYVDYVRDRRNADVHVLIANVPAGGGGEQYTVTFLGRNRFAGINDTTIFSTNSTMSNDAVRQKLVQAIEIGLLPYVSKTKMIENITLDVTADIKEEVEDPWNYWVYELELFGDLEGEESREEHRVFGAVNAERVTKDLKLDFRADGHVREEQFTFTDSAGNEITATSNRQWWNIFGNVIPTINDHWAYGGFFRTNSNSYRNIDLSYEFFGGIEYNIFPYPESVQREFRLQYRLGYIHYDYVEETLYNKTEEGLFKNRFEAIVTFTQPWGETVTTLEASSYLNDFSKNRVVFDAELEIFLFEGFSLDINGRYSIINDQINLAKGNLSSEDVLLRQQELATNYEYNLRVGISYTFGSIYNNVVNPRFEPRF
ncbi:MAG: hypothetical protein K9N46_16335 [Candidatus Marinimicrobia bacterium]|nr:hypothetical protein [Candidatus Neomarinimicrobiota bacterium]MCF7830323.1 hypothetical protein [Candidatus Neomarinimicrobiota bacterium]MCF7882300.1 hypothetical protein [Candidatus Neomarinimicrobiota bacterium]